MNSDQQSNYWKPDTEEGASPNATQDATVTDQTPSPATAPINSVAPNEPPYVSPSEVITWQAKEYIHQERNATWFIAVISTAIVLLGLAVFLMKAYTFAILIVVMTVAVVVLAKRPPHVLKYTLSQKGLYVENQLHQLEEYKSFGVIHDEGEYSVMLVPTKRFSPSLTVYFPADLGEKIVDFLGQRLPMQDLQLDVVDKLVRKLRL